MEKKILDDVVEQTQALLQAETCCQDLKNAANSWLNAIGTDSEAEETKKYLQELEEDIMPIDQLIAFASSDNGKGYFGEELAAQIVSHSTEMKEKGDKYCDCPACVIVGNILSKKEEMLK